LALPGFDEGRGKSCERTIELRGALGYVVLMTAKIYSLSREVREAALDLKTIQRRIRDADHRAHEWYPAQASARAKMATLSLAQGADRELLPRNQGGLPHCPAKEVSLAGQSEPWSHQKNSLARRARDGLRLRREGLYLRRSRSKESRL
jgi:hypothetical protein